MSVIGESGLSRALVLHMCCNELPIPDYRPFFVSITFVPGSSFFLFVGRRGRAIVSSSKSSRTREEGPGPGLKHQLCAYANYSSTMQPCAHMVVRHYLHDTSPSSRKQTHRACFRVHSTCLSRMLLFSQKTVDRWYALLQSCFRHYIEYHVCFILVTDSFASLKLKYTWQKYRERPFIAIL